ncbi:uncharacterized protein LOC106171458 isoform X2 [Lingula anatina]|uniref:Tumor protein p53-inducible protein 11 n=1 Tax=Lingula anatina TaxID=7574 RepID=A0A1S3JA39_LINAN|nr:uncharacterized protein LOC106171458 isoform X2 [Lingula anatina]XP_013407270.1 uncharacterized protein LOC106171458 isoform X2 [Lingula anatina]|eukprot:XP_013407269.1 uncharacterized protein LOC106171458 isoform X2 [Lingula anatina]
MKYHCSIKATEPGDEQSYSQNGDQNAESEMKSVELTVEQEKVEVLHPAETQGPLVTAGETQVQSKTRVKGVLSSDTCPAILKDSQLGYPDYPSDRDKEQRGNMAGPSTASDVDNNLTEQDEVGWSKQMTDTVTGPDIERPVEEKVVEELALLKNLRRAPVSPKIIKHKGRVGRLHKLERKHSSGDLQSRLKTRKLLGVGETDDGDVHRSKLSQILGHSEQLYTKLPKGLRLWQYITGVWFFLIAVWALCFPAHFFGITFDQENSNHLTVPLRLYGAALLSFALLFWSTWVSVDKNVIKWSVVSSTVYFSIHAVVSLGTLLVNGGVSRYSALLLLCRMGFIGVSIYYYLALDSKLIHLQRMWGCVNQTGESSSAATPSPNGEGGTWKKEN